MLDRCTCVYTEICVYTCASCHWPLSCVSCSMLHKPILRKRSQLVKHSHSTLVTASVQAIFKSCSMFGKKSPSVVARTFVGMFWTAASFVLPCHSHASSEVLCLRQLVLANHHRTSWPKWWISAEVSTSSHSANVDGSRSMIWQMVVQNLSSISVMT